jgi:anti-repressor protein
VKDSGGEPWFVARDVCAALEIKNMSDALGKLDEDEKGVALTDTLGGTQRMSTVSEPGLYSLIMRSRKPEAHAFKRWVTHEVLPSIRKDGGYMVAREDESDEQVMARALLIADKALKARDARIAELEPKARFADAVAASDGTCLVGELAKMLRQNGVDVGQNRLFAKLRDDGFLGKVGQNRNVPTQRAMDMGLFRIKETAVTHSDGHTTITRTPKVTGKGQTYFMARYAGGIA